MKMAWRSAASVRAARHSGVGVHSSRRILPPQSEVHPSGARPASARAWRHAVVGSIRCVTRSPGSGGAGVRSAWSQRTAETASLTRCRTAADGSPSSSSVTGEAGDSCPGEAASSRARCAARGVTAAVSRVLPHGSPGGSRQRGASAASGAGASLLARGGGAAAGARGVRAVP